MRTETGEIKYLTERGFFKKKKPHKTSKKLFTGLVNRIAVEVTHGSLYCKKKQVKKIRTSSLTLYYPVTILTSIESSAHLLLRFSSSITMFFFSS